MGMRSACAPARAARFRLAAIVFSAGVVSVLALGSGVPLARAAALAAVAAPRGGQPAEGGSQLAALAVIADFRGGGGPLAVNPADGRVYVSEANGLAVLNGLTGQAIGTIPWPGGAGASAVGVDPATDTIYAVTSQAVLVVSGRDDKVTATIAGALSPGQIAVDPRTESVYVSKTGSDTITVIDGGTNTVATTISVGDSVAGIAVDPATDTVYAASGDGTVSVISGSSDTVTATISAGAGLDAIAVNPLTDTVYAGSGQAISVISGAARTVTATIKGGAASLAADPRTDTIYAMSPTGYVEALNGRTNTFVAVIAPQGPSFPPPGFVPATGYEVAVNPAAGTVYSVYSVQEEFGPVSHLGISGSCASGVRISPGTFCAKLAARIQPNSVSFANPAHGVVLGGAGLMATADGGKHWRFLPAPPGGGNVPQTSPRVLFTSPDDGWLDGQWHTTDGGATWRLADPGGATPVAMAATATTVYAAVSRQTGPGELYAWRIGGTTWTRVPRITTHFTGLAASGHAVWLTEQTHLWITADGRHWHRYPARCPAGYLLAGVTAASPAHVAFLCARPGRAGSQTVSKEILTSTDGGRTMRLAGRAPANGTPQAFASPPGNPAVITITAGGTNFTRTVTLYRSVNGGRTWTTQILRTTDGGFSSSSLTYTSRTTGWLTFDGQVLMHTTNSGLTWQKTTP